MKKLMSFMLTLTFILSLCMPIQLVSAEEADVNDVTIQAFETTDGYWSIYSAKHTLLDEGFAGSDGALKITQGTDRMGGFRLRTNTVIGKTYDISIVAKPPQDNVNALDGNRIIAYHNYYTLDDEGNKTYSNGPHGYHSFSLSGKEEIGDGWYRYYAKYTVNEALAGTGCYTSGTLTEFEFRANTTDIEYVVDDFICVPTDYTNTTAEIESRYVIGEDFEAYEAGTNAAEITGVSVDNGMVEIAEDENGSKALFLNTGDKLSFDIEGNKRYAIISFDVRSVKHNDSGDSCDFGSVTDSSTDKRIIHSKISGSNVVAHFVAESSSNYVTHNCGVYSIAESDSYKTIKYVIDKTDKVFYIYADGKIVSSYMGSKMSYANEGTPDTLIFNPTRADTEYYIDNIIYEISDYEPIDYEENFQSVESVDKISGAIGIDNTKMSIVTEDDGNKAIKIDGAVNLKFTPNGKETSSDKVEISYKLKVDEYAGASGVKNFGTVYDSSSKKSAYIRYLNSGLLMYFGTEGKDNVTCLSFADIKGDNEYHTMKYLIDFSTKTYEFYIDDIKKYSHSSSTLGFNEEAVNAASINFQTVTGDIMYIDDVTIKDIVPESGSVLPIEPVEMTGEIKPGGSLTAGAKAGSNNTSVLYRIYSSLDNKNFSILKSGTLTGDTITYPLTDSDLGRYIKMEFTGKSGSAFTNKYTTDSVYVGGISIGFTSNIYDETISATAKIFDENISSEEIAAVIGLYDKSGKLLGTYINSKNTDQLENNTITISGASKPDTYSAKAFLWKWDGSIMPVADSAAISVPARQDTLMNNICADRLADVITSTELSEEEYAQKTDEYVGQYLKNTTIGRMLYNINYSRSCVTSDVMDSLYYNISRDADGNIQYDSNGEVIREVNAAAQGNDMLNKLRTLEERGIDLYEMAVDAAHKYDAEAWLSVRMADHHNLSDENFNSKYHISLCGTGYKNYNIEGLRNNYKDYILEICEKYDVDGIELDWLRSPGVKINEDISIQFMRDIRNGINEIAESKGKEIKIAVRLLPTIGQNENSGYYVKQWLSEGLVDTIIPMNWYTPTNYSLDLASWRNELDTANTSNHPYELIGGMDYGVGCNGKNMWITAEHVKGFTSYIYNEGSDGVYMFNHCFISGVYVQTTTINSDGTVTNENCLEDKWEAIKSVQASETGLRRHLYSEQTKNGVFHQNETIYPLTVNSTDSKTVTLNTGSKPENGYYVVALGIKNDDANFADNNIELSVNGVKAKQIGDAPTHSSYPFKDVAQISHISQCGSRVMQFSVDINEVNDGDNTFVISGTDSAGKNIVWLEVFVNPDQGAFPIEKN